MLIRNLSNRLIYLFLLSLVCFATSTVIARNPSTPRYEPAECSFSVPDDIDVECGNLVVMQDRDNPGQGELRLAVAIMRTDSRNKAADPIIHLTGGPGNSWLRAFEQAHSLFQLENSDRDVIVFDQRGVGFSEPDFDCPNERPPGVDELSTRLIEGDMDAIGDIQALQLDYYIACGEALSETYDLRDFSTRASAADVHDLAVALDYEQVNLWGWSYGTRLGLTVMRNYPDLVRSATLDSVVTPQDNTVTVRSGLRRALDAFFAACEADSMCAETYPDLERVTFDVARRLNETPALLEVPGGNGETRELPVVGASFLMQIISALNFPGMYSQLPEIIYEVNDGNTEAFLPLLIGSAPTPVFDQALNYTVNCREEFATLNPDALAYSESTYLPELNQSIRTPEMTDSLCEAFDSGDPLPETTVPVYSEIPTLLVAGAFDPSTPPSNTITAGNTLPNSYYLEVPAGGHGETLFSDCSQQIMVDFFQKPTQKPDTTCVTNPSIQFDSADAADANDPSAAVSDDIRQIDFADVGLSISAELPANWEAEEQAGSYINPDTQSRLILLNASDAETTQAALDDFAINALDSRLDDFTEQESVDSEFGTWTTYRSQVAGREAVLAALSSDDAVVIAAYYGTADEIDAVFIPLLTSAFPQ